MTVSAQTTSLPNDPLSKQLLKNAQTNPYVLIHDPSHNKDATSLQFLHDIVSFRHIILSGLPEHYVHCGRLQTPGLYIAILAPLSYDYLVALYAIISIGAAAVPLTTKVLPEEGAWLLNKCNAICLLAQSDQVQLAFDIQSQRQTTHPSPVISIQHSPCETPELPKIDPSLAFPPSQPGLLLFTSGTTGPPKGVILPRQLFFPHVSPDCTADDIAIVWRVVNGLAGILNIIDLIHVGARLEIFLTGMQPAPIWERLSSGGITVLAGAPRFWQVLMTHYEENLEKLPKRQRALYDEGARNLRLVWFGGGMPSPAAKRFWLNLRGKEWAVKYGASELGREAMVFRFSSESETLKPYIGIPLPETEASLTDGQHGELLIKSPTMMLGYIDDEERTRAAFDGNGFWRTGDLVHRDADGRFVFDGRASVDFVRFKDLRVSVYEVESRLCELPYLVEAYVLGIPDVACGHRVGALVVLGLGETSLTLGQLRKDLATVLPAYKLPTVLRTVLPKEELPRSPEGKLSRKLALQKFFPIEANGLPSMVEVWDLNADEKVPRKAWDWAGYVA